MPCNGTDAWNEAIPIRKRCRPRMNLGQARTDTNQHPARDAAAAESIVQRVSRALQDVRVPESFVILPSIRCTNARLTSLTARLTDAPAAGA
jgi:hypothetical protein